MTIGTSLSQLILCKTYLFSSRLVSREVHAFWSERTLVTKKPHLSKRLIDSTKIFGNYYFLEYTLTWRLTVKNKFHQDHCYMRKNQSCLVRPVVNMTVNKIDI